MLEILRFLFGWLDKAGGGALCGFFLGVWFMVLLQRRRERMNHCYYADWIANFRGEQRLAAIVAKENQKMAVELIEEDRKKHPPEPGEKE
jgi:cbb3-type cytochrome oxidase subunit 3